MTTHEELDCCFFCRRKNKGDCPNPCQFLDSGKKCKDPERCIKCENGFQRVTDQDITALIHQYYKQDRLTGRDGPVWGEDYSKVVITGRLEDIRKYGNTLISCHESVTGKAVKIYAGGMVEQ
jgi:hypothetical protein